MTGLLHRVLLALHARGFHPAVLAGLIMMPAVVAAGFLTHGSTPRASLPTLSDLRSSFGEPATPSKTDQP